MIQHEAKGSVEAPAAAVFACLSDISRLLEYDASISVLEEEAAGEGEAARWKFSRQVGKRPVTGWIGLSESQPNELVVLAEDRPPFRMVTAWRLQEQGERTLVVQRTWISDLWPGMLKDPLAPRALLRENALRLQGLTRRFTPSAPAEIAVEALTTELRVPPALGVVQPAPNAPIEGFLDALVLVTVEPETAYAMRGLLAGTPHTEVWETQGPFDFILAVRRTPEGSALAEARAHILATPGVTGMSVCVLKRNEEKPEQRSVLAGVSA